MGSHWRKRLDGLEPCSGVAHLFRPLRPRRAGRLLENSWRLRSPGQKRGGPARLAELRPSRVGLPRLLSGPECGHYAIGNSRWPCLRYVNG